METAEVVVVGAGIMGVSTAYHLARLGAGRVIVLEAPDAFNRAAARFLEDPRRTG